MITPAEISRLYNNAEPYFQPLRALVREAIQPFADAQGYAVSSRIKSLNSLAEKIETGRYSSWKDLDDLVAFTVVVPTLSHEKSVVDFLSDVFTRIDLKLRGSTQKPPDSFRFDSTRFNGRLASIAGQSRPELEGITFEIQIRSAFEHAWSVTTHALSYKAADVSWKRQRLAAQLKASVEQLDILILGFEDAMTKIDQSPWPRLSAQQTISDGFDAMVKSGRLPHVLAPNDWSRFSDNVFRVIASSRWAQGKRPQEVADAAISAVNSELAVVAEDVPLSVSLWQFTFASLCKAGVIAPPLRQHWPVITPELEQLYPSLEQFAVRFGF